MISTGDNHHGRFATSAIDVLHLYEGGVELLECRPCVLSHGCALHMWDYSSVC